jgi:hypothetical protein
VPREVTGLATGLPKSFRRRPFLIWYPWLTYSPAVFAGRWISRQWTAPIDDTPKAACVFKVFQQDTRQGRAINQKDWRLASRTGDLKLVGNNARFSRALGGQKSSQSLPIISASAIHANRLSTHQSGDSTSGQVT